MSVYRVVIIVADDPRIPQDNREVIAKFAGCVSEDDARRKARECYAPRVLSIKSVKKVENV